MTATDPVTAAEILADYLASIGELDVAANYYLQQERKNWRAMADPGAKPNLRTLKEWKRLLSSRK